MTFLELFINGTLVACFIVAIYYFKKYMGGGVCKSTSDLSGKTVIITGANTGIGKETALELVKRGARVILACRDTIRAQEAVQDIKKETGKIDNVAFYKLDLSNMASIYRFVDQFHRNEQRLDILINNAGVMWCPYALTDDGFEIQFGVNHLGHFLLTNLLIDDLKETAPSRIINLTSMAHYWAEINFDDLMSKKQYDPSQAYAQSKLANVLFTKELARQLKDTGVTSYAVHPGVAMTEIGRYMDILKKPIVKYFIFPLLMPIQWLCLKSPWQGAQTTLHCATADELRGESGRYYSDCKEKAAGEKAEDEETARRLWEISSRLVKLEDINFNSTSLVPDKMTMMNNVIHRNGNGFLAN